jgi:hypothetical protein
MMPTTVTSQDEAENSQHSSAMTTSPGRYRGKPGNEAEPGYATGRADVRRALLAMLRIVTG